MHCRARPCGKHINSGIILEFLSKLYAVIWDTATAVFMFIEGVVSVCLCRLGSGGVFVCDKPA